MSEHARLSPSNPRWVHCPGSVREEAKYPDEPASAAAVDGTGSHLLLELCLINGVNALEYDTQRIGEGHHDKQHGWLVDRERCERVQMCLDYLKTRTAQLEKEFPEGYVQVEAEEIVHPGKPFDRDDWWGTSDVCITVNTWAGDLLYAESVDYKDGRGWVSEKGNSQLVSYLWGNIFSRFSEVVAIPCRMTIVQPKTHPPVRYCEATSHEVKDVATKLAQSAKLTDDPNAPLISGKHCQWCKHKPDCTAQLEEQQTMIDKSKLPNTFHRVLIDYQRMHTKDLIDVLELRQAMTKVFEVVENEVAERIKKGKKVPGYTLAPGRATRKWAESEKEVAKRLKNYKFTKAEIYPPKLVSPAQAEKNKRLSEVQKANLQEHIVSVTGEPKLKKVKDSRPNEKDLFADKQIPESFI